MEKPDTFIVADGLPGQSYWMRTTEDFPLKFHQVVCPDIMGFGGTVCILKTESGMVLKNLGCSTRASRVDGSLQL